MQSYLGNNFEQLSRVPMGAWTPAAMASPLVFLYVDPLYCFSDAGTTPCIASSTVYRWVDIITGAIYDQSDSAKRFTFNVGANGQCYVSGDGARYMDCTSTTVGNVTGNFTASALVNKTTASSDKYIWSKQQTAAPYKGVGLSQVGGKPAIEISDGTYGILSGTTSWGGANGWKEITATRSSTSGEMIFGGASEATGTVRGGDTSFSIASRIGNFTGGSAGWIGSIRGFVLTAAQATAGEKSLLSAFWTAKTPT